MFQSIRLAYGAQKAVNRFALAAQAYRTSSPRPVHGDPPVNRAPSMDPPGTADRSTPTCTSVLSLSWAAAHVGTPQDFFDAQRHHGASAPYRHRQAASHLCGVSGSPQRIPLTNTEQDQASASSGSESRWHSTTTLQTARVCLQSASTTHYGRGLDLQPRTSRRPRGARERSHSGVATSAGRPGPPYPLRRIHCLRSGLRPKATAPMQRITIRPGPGRRVYVWWTIYIYTGGLRHVGLGPHGSSQTDAVNVSQLILLLHPAKCPPQVHRETIWPEHRILPEYFTWSDNNAHTVGSRLL